MKRFSSAVIVSASLLAAAAFPSPAQTKEVLLQELDKTISESEKYVSDKLLRIKTIENNLHSRGVSPEKQYEIYGELFDEYQTFNYGKATQKTASRKTSGAEDEFHTYALEWTPTYIKTYVDGTLLLNLANDGAGNVSTWPFNKKFYITLNLAWGGDWGGYAGVDESKLPATMQVDYVRVFQKK